MAYTTIPKSSAYFEPEIYTGNGSSKTISTLNFQPDWVWIKNRATSDMNVLFDSLRGATKRIASDSTSAEATEAQDLTAFNTNGFTVGTSGAVNTNNVSYASWNWKANGAGSSNTDGSINTTKTSANTTSGFSISTYTGTGANATVGHGLGVTPKMFIVKRLNSTGAFRTYVEPLGNLGQLALNATDEVSDVASMWNSTSPTNSTISIGTHAGVNASGGTYVAYCFADVQGFSKIGSYLGNGHANGTFAYTGFKPAFILVKNTGNSARNWQIYDSKRIGYNYNNYRIATNLPQTEESNLNIDIYSNGFKARSTDADVNENAKTYIYMAFAEEPLVSTNGTPATAR
jgi:hypothetical protein